MTSFPFDSLGAIINILGNTNVLSDNAIKYNIYFSVKMKSFTAMCRHKRISGWCVWRAAPVILFFNFVSKRQNRKFESGSPRKSRCFRTSVVEPNNLTRIFGDL